MQKIFSHIYSQYSLDTLFISHPVNIGYLSGFYGSFGYLFILKDNRKILISDSRYTQNAQKLCKKKGIIYREISQKKDFWEKFFSEFSISHMGIESEHISLSKYKNLKKKFKNIKFTQLEHTVEKIRRIKTPEEILLLQKAAEIGDKSLSKTVEKFSQGVSEKDLAWIFEQTAKEIFGVESLSFDTIVAFGKNSASPHHHNTDTKLKINTPILIDCGVKYKGYCSDLTRCFWFGEKTGEEYQDWKKTYDLVKKAQESGIEKMKIGEKISSADTAARKIFADEEKFFGHSFGHGVGLDIHEYPGIYKSIKPKEKFLENMVVTAEPGLYYPGKFGIRIEDLLVIEKTTARKLSQSSY